MADKEDDNVELIETGDEGKLVDDENNNNESSDDRPQSAGSGGKEEEDEDEDEDEEREDTADLDEDQEYEGDEYDGEGEGENNDIKFTNVEDTSTSTQKLGFLQKLKHKLGIRPKIHDSDQTVMSSSTVTMKYIPPPAPHNMPSARDAAKARIFRREKVRYGKQKMIFYMDAMKDRTLVIDDLVMKSEMNTSFVKGV